MHSLTIAVIAAASLLTLPVSSVAAGAADADGPAGAPATWSLGKIPAPGRGPVSVRAVTVGPRGFVAVGETCPKRFSCIATAWTSPDGIDWSVVDVDRAERRAGRAPSSSVFDVAWGPGGYVAVGEFTPPWIDPAPGTDGPNPWAAVWHSKDGKRWRRVVSDNPFASNPTPSDIVATDSGYLAFSAGRSRVLVSDDGVRWSRRPADGVVKGASFGEAASTGDGFVTLGQAHPETVERDGSGRSSVIWHTQRGERWTPTVVADPDSYLGRLAAVGERVVVVQGPGIYDERAVPHGGLTRVIDGDVAMSAVPGADGLYAVGEVGERFLVAGQACGPALWTSADGIDWQRLAWSGELPRGATRWHDVDIVANGERVVLVGTAELPGKKRRFRPPKLVNFALSAPISALDDGKRPEQAPGSACQVADMPVAQLATPDGTVVAGLPTEGCWMTADADGAVVATCREDVAPRPSGLPLVSAAGERVPLRLTLSDGSAFTAVSVLEYDTRGDITSAGEVFSSGSCTPQSEASFEARAGTWVLVVWVTFECGQGSGAYMFHFQTPRDTG